MSFGFLEKSRRPSSSFPPGCLMNPSQSWRGTDLHFTKEKTEIQGGYASSTRSHRKPKWWGLNLSLLDSSCEDKETCRTDSPFKEEGRELSAGGSFGVSSSHREVTASGEVLQPSTE